MNVRKLSTISIEELLDCFLLAFDNYFVKMPTDYDYYRERWKAAKVDFNLSYGMFDKEKLVGFIIHAVDKRKGEQIAYNTGTGVIPEYRGRKIIKSIYQYALRDMKEHGIEKTTLEVITKNDIALHLYKSIGFEISRNYKCFKGKINDKVSIEAELAEIDINKIDWEKLPNQQMYSWDNQKESILEGNYRYFNVLLKGKPESFFIINTDQNYLAQFDLFNNESDGWKRLFSGIKQVSDTIRVNNVDHNLHNKLNILHLIGLENVVDQFEMELKVKGKKDT